MTKSTFHMISKTSYLFAVLIFLFSVGGCSEKQLVSPEESEKQLIFSHGGGFAGKYKTYYLLENGQLFKGKEMYGTSKPVKSLPKNVAQQIFSNYEILRLGEKNITSYGNLNHTLIYKDEKGEKKSFWEKNQEDAKELQLFYLNVMNIIKNNNGQDSPREKKNFEIK